jgi:hypothetical protein
MKKILLLGLSTFILNAYVPVTITGKATGDGEKVKKEALSDLSNQISVEVKSSYKQLSLAIANSYKNSQKKLIELKSELPLKSVRFVYEDGETMAVLTSQYALKIYEDELSRLKKEIDTTIENLKNVNSKTVKYKLYKSLIINIENFNKHKIVATILNGENLPVLSVSESDIKLKLRKLIKSVDSISLATELLSQGINEKNIYIYPIKTNSSDEITQFSRVLKQDLSNKLYTVYKPSEAEYFIRGTYEILKGSIFVTIKIMDMNNKVLNSNSVMLDNVAYKSMSYEPKTLNFDESINKNFTKNEFKVNLGIKGYYSSNGVDLTEGDDVNLVLKTNKPMCYYVVGHTLKPSGKKYSYLLQLKDDEGREAFIDRIIGEDVNTNYSLGEMEVVAPFGRESLHLFAQTLTQGKCKIAIPKCEWRGSLCIITGKPEEVVQKTRALSLKKPFKAQKAEVMVDFTSFKKDKK